MRFERIFTVPGTFPLPEVTWSRESMTGADSDIRTYKKVERRLAAGAALRTDKKTSERMGRVRQRGTAPELALRRLAWSEGLRFTTRNADLPGSPDLANRKKKLAVFVHGCFWHQHVHCKRATIPKRNRQFWTRKFDRNRQRDVEALNALQTHRFRVIVVWECELSDLQCVARRLRYEAGPLE